MSTRPMLAVHDPRRHYHIQRYKAAEPIVIHWLKTTANKICPDHKALSQPFSPRTTEPNYRHLAEAILEATKSLPPDTLDWQDLCNAVRMADAVVEHRDKDREILGDQADHSHEQWIYTFFDISVILCLIQHDHAMSTLSMALAEAASHEQAEVLVLKGDSTSGPRTSLQDTSNSQDPSSPTDSAVHVPRDEQDSTVIDPTENGPDTADTSSSPLIVRLTLPKHVLAQFRKEADKQREKNRKRHVRRRKSEKKKKAEKRNAGGVAVEVVELDNADNYYFFEQIEAEDEEEDTNETVRELERREQLAQAHFRREFSRFACFAAAAWVVVLAAKTMQQGG